MKQQVLKVTAIASLLLGLTACSTLNEMVYRIDLPQGNFLEQRDVDKLRLGMTQEQVIYVLGRPVADNAFNESRWVYLYEMNPNRGDVFRKELVLDFENGKLASMSGDFDKPEDFDSPLDA